MFVQAQGPAPEVQRALQSIAGVTRVNIADTRGDIATFDVDTEKGSDVRRELASAIVRGGWGLLELRPMRMSLEDIFLSLTTEETEAPAVVAEEAVQNA
jgi:ABC-2 type transport system ATP-binding protein